MAMLPVGLHVAWVAAQAAAAENTTAAVTIVTFALKPRLSMRMIESHFCSSELSIGISFFIVNLRIAVAHGQVTRKK
jgi:hypothetical protein